MSGFMPMRQMLQDVLDLASSENDDGVVFEEDGLSPEMSSLEGARKGRDVPEAIVLNAFRQDVLSLDGLSLSERPRVLSTPVFYGHGSEDNKVSCTLGNNLVGMLKQLRMDLRHQVYPGLGHWMKVPEEIDDMISVFRETGAWPDHVDGSSNTPAS